MIRRKAFANFYSPEEVRDLLRDSLQIVGEQKVPDDLRAQAFTLVFDKLATRHVELEQIDATGVLLNNKH